MDKIILIFAIGLLIFGIIIAFAAYPILHFGLDKKLISQNTSCKFELHDTDIEKRLGHHKCSNCDEEWTSNPYM